LAKFKNIPLEDVCTGIKKMDQKMFTMEQVKVLSSCLPSRDDIGVVQNFVQTGGTEAKLSVAEKFVLKLDSVSAYDERVKSFLFMLSFDSKKLDCDQGVQLLKKACKEIQQSKSLPHLFDFILEVGNFINEGSPRGGGFGFKLGSLSKLEDIKASDNKTTLLQFIFKLLETSSPQLLKFHEELPSIEGASKISLQTITSDLSSMKKDAEITIRFNDNIKLKEQLPVLSNFVNKVKGSLETTEKNYTELNESYKSVVNYLGEDPVKCPPEEFFGILHRFIHSCQEAIKLNENAIAIEEKQKKREEARIHRMKKLSQTLEREALEAIKQSQQKKKINVAEQQSKN